MSTCLALSIAPSLSLVETYNTTRWEPLNQTSLSVPRRFQYKKGLYKVIYTYPGAARGSPTVSPKNWRAAVSVATENIQALEVMARDDAEDPIPGNRFDFATTLAHPAPKHARQPERSLKFELLGTDDEPLTYEDVNVALLGLLNYAAVWDRGSKSDEIRM
ncbi:MAG: hypothetical protein ASARMPREDX12_005882, partial [Alectoria sarmentosa]